MAASAAWSLSWKPWVWASQRFGNFFSVNTALRCHQTKTTTFTSTEPRRAAMELVKGFGCKDYGELLQHMKELKFLKKAHNLILDYSSKLNFDKTHRYHFNLVALQGSIIELSHCIIILLEKNGTVGISSIFRTIMETYVELINLSNCRTYGYCMEFAYNKQWLFALQNAKNDNPFLQGISEKIDLDSEISGYNDKLKNLSSQGYRQLKISERFEIAGMENEYYSLYNFLSCDSHSNIRALISRHFECSDDDYNLVYYRNYPVESLLPYIDTTVRYLVNSAVILHRELGSEKINKLEELLDRYNAISIESDLPTS